MVRRFEDTSSPVVARLRPVFSGEFRLSVFHGDCTLLCERLFPRESDALAHLYRTWPRMREVA